MGSLVCTECSRGCRSLGVVFFTVKQVKTSSFIFASIERSWAYFLDALSGLFCASLTDLGKPGNYMFPKYSHRPHGLFENKTSDMNFRYAQLPREGVCTENLTPWAKLLPCKRWKGLASLLKPQSIYKARYNSLTVDVRKMCAVRSYFQT